MRSKKFLAAIAKGVDDAVAFVQIENQYTRRQILEWLVGGELDDPGRHLAVSCALASIDCELGIDKAGMKTTLSHLEQFRRAVLNELATT